MAPRRGRARRRTGFERLLEKLGVAIELGREVTASLVEQRGPDAVVLATGGTLGQVAVPGIEGKIVAQSADLHETLRTSLDYAGPGKIRKASKAWLPLAQRVVILGGGFQACQLAIFPVKQGRTVTLVEAGPEIGDGVVPHALAQLLPWLAAKDVETLTRTRCEEITDRGLVLQPADGERCFREADSIVPILPFTAGSDLAATIEGKVAEVICAGSSRRPGLIVDAVADGARVGHQL